MEMAWKGLMPSGNKDRVRAIAQIRIFFLPRLFVVQKKEKSFHMQGHPIRCIELKG